jgi:glutathione S-transferase
VPADPWQAAKVRELTIFIDLHLELVARELYGKAFFGGDISDEPCGGVHNAAARERRRASGGWRGSRRTSRATRSRWPIARAYASLPLRVAGDQGGVRRGLLAAAASTGSRTAGSSASGRARSAWWRTERRRMTARPA